MGLSKIRLTKLPMVNRGRRRRRSLVDFSVDGGEMKLAAAPRVTGIGVNELDASFCMPMMNQYSLQRIRIGIYLSIKTFRHRYAEELRVVFSLLY